LNVVDATFGQRRSWRPIKKTPALQQQLHWTNSATES
jgi:hypothetical protein